MHAEPHPPSAGLDAAELHCPECGAPAPFRGGVISLVCEWCGSTVVREGVDLELVGKVSAILDTGSPILLESRGRLGELPFAVSGRLQLVWARGTWNEWFLTFADGTIGWLADAQGSWAVVRPRASVPEPLPPFARVEVGRELTIAGIAAVVVDKRSAAYQGAEGVLPFRAEPGLTFSAVDLRGYGGELVTLDYGTVPDRGPPVVYSGRSVALAEIELFPLRRFEGWR